MAEHKVDENYNGETFLRHFYPIVKNNMRELLAWIVGHINGTADRHTAEHIDYAAGQSVKSKLDAETSERKAEDVAIRKELTVYPADISQVGSGNNVLRINIDGIKSYDDLNNKIIRVYTGAYCNTNTIPANIYLNVNGLGNKTIRRPITSDKAGYDTKQYYTDLYNAREINRYTTMELSITGGSVTWLNPTPPCRATAAQLEEGTETAAYLTPDVVKPKLDAEQTARELLETKIDDLSVQKLWSDNTDENPGTLDHDSYKELGYHLINIDGSKCSEVPDELKTYDGWAVIHSVTHRPGTGDYFDKCKQTLFVLEMDIHKTWERYCYQINDEDMEYSDWVNLSEDKADPRIVIASETSTDKAKAAADFVFANDANLLNNMQTAFNTLPETGGEIHLCAGTFDFTASGEALGTLGEGGILSIPFNNTTITGEGAGTILTHNSNNSQNFVLIEASSKSNIVVKDICFEVGACAYGIRFINGINSKIENTFIDMIDNDANGGISIMRGKNISITNNYMNLQSYNIGINILTGVAQGINISSNTFISNLEENVCVNLGPAKRLMVHDNTFNMMNGTAFQLSTAATGCVYNNFIYKGGDTVIAFNAPPGENLNLNMDGSMNDWNKVVTI